MKIQIDTTNKTIKLETSENLGEFFTAIEQMLPNGLWKEFKLETNTVITWVNPIRWRDIYIQPYIQPVTYPWITQPITPNPYPTTPWITYGGQETSEIKMQHLQSGVYNVEC